MRALLIAAAAGVGLLWSGGLAVQAADPGGYEIVDFGIPTSLTGQAGDPKKGVEVILNRRQGNCLACHKVTALADEPFHGEIGPPLDGVADRWEESQIRLIIVNSKAVFPDTAMPAFYSTEGTHRVAPEYQGKTILTKEQVEDVVAFLKTLKE